MSVGALVLWQNIEGLGLGKIHVAIIVCHFSLLIIEWYWCLFFFCFQELVFGLAVTLENFATLFVFGLNASLPNQHKPISMSFASRKWDSCCWKLKVRMVLS